MCSYFAADAKNNGTLTWHADIDNSASSGCNYSIYIKAWTVYAYSGYFAVINTDDGGINPDAECPVDVGMQKPDDGNCWFNLH
jgi:hypothetical protein